MNKPTDHFNYANSILSADGVSLEGIAKTYGTPTYVYSARALLEPLRALQAGLTGMDSLVCFAVKSNSNLAILKLLGDAGAGADIVSGGELFRARRAGIPASRIVFSGVGKSLEEMNYGLSEGVYSFNAESVAELKALNAVAKAAGKTARVALRFNPDVNAKTHPYISTGLKKNKFGIPKAELMKVLAHWREFDHLKLCGLSIHIGSQLLELAPLNDAYARLKMLVAEIEKAFPEQTLEFLDLGGGVGITYRKEKTATLARYSSLIRKHFGPGKLKRPMRIVLEPGRTLCGNAGVLLTKVLYRKERGKKDFLIIDAAMNDLLRPALYGSYHEIVPIRSPKGGKTKLTDVVGPVCESSDCFGSDRKLPADLSNGDVLAILSAGAYGFTMSSNYNTRPRPAEVLVSAEGKVREVRRRESLEDLLRGEESEI